MNNKLTPERIEAAKEHAEKGAQYYNGALNDYKNKFKKEPEMFLEGEYDATFDYIENRIEYYDTSLALANAELERQSVTEEDVAEAIERVNEQINTLADIIDELVEEQGEEAMVRDVKEALRTEITCLAALQAYRPEREACEWDCEPGAEEMRKELSAKYGHAINALMDYNKTVYDWYDKFGPRQYCPFCGGRIGKQVREEYSDEDEREDESWTY